MPTIELPTDFRSSRDLFDECLERGAKYGELRSMPESRRGDDWDTDLARARRELLESNDAFDSAARLERFVIEAGAWEHAVNNPPSESRGPNAAMLDTAQNEYRSPGEIFTTDPYAVEHGFRTGDREVEVRNLLTGSSIGTSGSNLLAPVGSPFLQMASVQRQRLFVRDLLSVQGTSLSSVPYIRELDAGANEGGASAVSEASAKPEVTMQFESADAPIRKIAAWIQATEEALADAPTLSGYINERLGYMLKLREEQQILSGTGTTPEISGILDNSPQTQALGSDLFNAVGLAIGKVENVDGDADGVAVNPVTYWTYVTTRHSTVFDGEGFASSPGAPFGTPTMTIWGLPVVRTRSLASGHAIVGAWRLGATLFDRQATTIRTTDSHASLFISNTWVILAEERVGLAIHRPDFFCHIS